MIPVFERVYEIGKAYRAEKSNTSRHLTEFLWLDMEMWFIDSFDDIIEMTENYVNWMGYVHRNLKSGKFTPKKFFEKDIDILCLS